MGVEFFHCEACGKTICDAGDYYSCYDCYRHYCSDKCMEAHSLKLVSCDDCKTEEEAEKHGCYWYLCGYCRKEMATDSELLKYALRELDMSRDELQNEYLMFNGEK